MPASSGLSLDNPWQVVLYCGFFLHFGFWHLMHSYSLPPHCCPPHPAQDVMLWIRLPLCGSPSTLLRCSGTSHQAAAPWRCLPCLGSWLPTLGNSCHSWVLTPYAGLPFTAWTPYCFDCLPMLGALLCGYHPLPALGHYGYFSPNVDMLALGLNGQLGRGVEKMEVYFLDLFPVILCQSTLLSLS